ncbi:MAG: hypothetical protein M0C28_29630 [Candidatus Moduliflexus flocculans]|nr:hypothetical protein [Candidatus Moduliflexus flocculans]
MPAVIEGRNSAAANGARSASSTATSRCARTSRWATSITIRSTQGTDDEFFTLEVVGMADGQSYFFAAVHLRPVLHLGKDRARKSEAELNSDTPVPPTSSPVKLTDPAQIRRQSKQRMLDQVSSIEVADIPTTINNIPGYSAQQSTVQTQGCVHPVDRHPGHRRVLPDPDPAKSAADRRAESHRRLQPGRGLVGGDPDRGGDSHRRRDRRRC